jgi:hypothetical protein
MVFILDIIGFISFIIVSINSDCFLFFPFIVFGLLGYRNLALLIGFPMIVLILTYILKQLINYKKEAE